MVARALSANSPLAGFDIETRDPDGNARQNPALATIQTGTNGTPVNANQPAGFQRITDLSAAVGLTVPEGARRAMIQPENGGFRWRDDGAADPTEDVGLLVELGMGLDYDADLTAIRLIETPAGVGTVVSVAYYA